MKEKINKFFSVLRKDGFITTIKKLNNYIKSNYLSKINIWAFLHIKLHYKKYSNMFNEILNGNFDRIIIWRSSFGWDVSLFQRPQHISINLSNKKCLVFYEVTTMTDKVKNIKKMKDNLFLVNFNNTAISKLLFSKLQSVNTPKYIQIYSTDCNMPLKKLKKYISSGYKIIYEYIDDLSPELVGTKELPKNQIDKYNFMLNNINDVFVVVTADEIQKDVVSKRGNEKLVFSCNGVDYNHFQDIDTKFSFENKFQNLINLNKPIIGYYGALATWFDYDLIKYLAKSRPNYNIVLLGIKYDDSFDKAKLEKYSNIYFLGSKNYDILPAYASHFTVCTIPFLINDITQATSPLKLFEYMALGKPIVTTPMKECKKYESVMISKNQNDFVKLIDTAISLNPINNKDYFDTLHKEALQNTWEQKALAIIKLLKKYEN